MENRATHAFILLAFVVAFAQYNQSEQSKPAATIPAPAPSAVPSVVVSPAGEGVASGAANNALGAAQTPVNFSALPIPIEVYYEAMCVDSVNFFNKQLKPVYDELQKFINVTYIPFALGNITVDKENNTTINCSRQGECDADKVHACGIDKIKDSDKLVKFLTCALVDGYNSKNKLVPIEKCGKDSTVDNDVVTSITTCSDGSNSYPLLQKYHDLSAAVPIKNVPTIVFYKTYSAKNQESSLEDFKKTVCGMIPWADLPDYCKNIDSGSVVLAVGALPILIGVYYAIRMF